MNEKEKKSYVLKKDKSRGHRNNKDVVALILKKAGQEAVKKTAQDSLERLAKETGMGKTVAKKPISSARKVYQETYTEAPSVYKAITKGKEGATTAKEKAIPAAMKDKEFRRRVVHNTADHFLNNLKRKESEKMGININTADITKLLKDDKLVDEVVKKVVEDPEVLSDLASDVADEISDYLEDDPAIRQRIINAAIENPDFKKRLVKELVDEFGD